MAKSQFQMLRTAMVGVEAVVAETAHSFSKHTHDQFGIGLMVRGAQKSLSGRGMVEALAGNIITVNPNEVHDGTPISDQRAWHILYFSPDLISRVLADLTEGQWTSGEIAYPVFDDAVLSQQFVGLFAAVTNPGAAGLLREEGLLAVMARVMGGRIKAQPTGVPRSIRVAREMIDDDPALPISLSALANASALSRFQFLRAFKRATGMTPHAYMIQKRISVARSMIAGGMRLADAAFAAGFADQSHMTRIFVDKYGVSPGAYAAAVR